MQIHKCLFLMVLFFTYAHRPVPVDGPCLSLHAAFSDVFLDLFGNIYVLNSSSTELVKYNREGKLLCRYSNLSLGKISNVDVTNPLRILLFYKQRQALVFLDNQLSQQGDPLYLEQKGIMNVTHACSSSLSNGFWVYNEPENAFYRFSGENVLQIKSGNLRWFLGDDFHPAHMAEYNARLYISDSLHGIYIFDQFGTHNKTIPLRTGRFFFANEDKLWFTEKGKMIQYNFKFITTDTFTTDFPDAQKTLFIRTQKLYVFKDSIFWCHIKE